MPNCWVMYVKVLLDQSVPRQFATLCTSPYEVYTVQKKGWAGTENGLLIEVFHFPLLSIGMV